LFFQSEQPERNRCAPFHASYSRAEIWPSSCQHFWQINFHFCHASNDGSILFYDIFFIGEHSFAFRTLRLCKVTLQPPAVSLIAVHLLVGIPRRAWTSQLNKINKVPTKHTVSLEIKCPIKRLLRSLYNRA
jgi:hypothetical protein